MKNDRELYTIYFLSSRNKRNIFYVGCTKQPLKARLLGHLSVSNDNKRKTDKIQEYNYKIGIHEIEKVRGRRAALRAEKRRIEEFIKMGHGLCNGQDPNRPRKPKPETEQIKIHKDILKLVKEHKLRTHIPIGKFFELAAMEKLKSQK
jgi:predicted GIY-YIG superfamily endonuclease